MAEKSKHKNNPRAAWRFQALLFAWMLLMIRAAYYPLIWLVPPYTHLTPYLYIGVSLLWIPFTIRHLRRFGLRWLTMGLMAGCVLATGWQIEWWQRYDTLERVPVNVIAFDEGIIQYTINSGCTAYTLILIGFEDFPLAILTDNQFVGPAGYLCDLF